MAAHVKSATADPKLFERPQGQDYDDYGRLLAPVISSLRYGYEYSAPTLSARRAGLVWSADNLDRHCNFSFSQIRAVNPAAALPFHESHSVVYPMELRVCYMILTEEL